MATQSKELKGRITLKHDTETNWLKATNFIPLNGEIIIYDTDDIYDYPRVKVGDGTTYVNELPFIENSNEVRNKLNFTNIAYGICATAAATAAKVVTINNNNWILQAGSRVSVVFNQVPTSGSITLNVNGTGAKYVWYIGSNITKAQLAEQIIAGVPAEFLYDGIRYHYMGTSYDKDTHMTNATRGQGYGTCATEASTIQKVVTLPNDYSAMIGGIITVNFTYSVPANATMKINNLSAKPIYYKGAAITADIIKEGNTATFIYDGTNYHLISIDNLEETTIYDTMVNWGGEDLAGSWSPIDAGLNSSLGGNYFAGLDETSVSVEISTDAGTTWTTYDYNYLANAIKATFSDQGVRIGNQFYLGGLSASASSENRLRFTIIGSQEKLYGKINKIAIYHSKAGNVLRVQVEGQKKSDSSWETIKSNIHLNGYPNWGILNFSDPIIVGPSSTSLNEYIALRLTFSNDNATGKPFIKAIQAYGTARWATQSHNLQQSNHLYNWDANFNATFPGGLTAISIQAPQNYSVYQSIASNKPYLKIGEYTFDGTWQMRTAMITIQDPANISPTSAIVQLDTSTNATTINAINTRITQIAGNDISDKLAYVIEGNTVTYYYQGTYNQKVFIFALTSNGIKIPTTATATDSITPTGTGTNAISTMLLGGEW